MHWPLQFDIRQGSSSELRLNYIWAVGSLCTLWTASHNNAAWVKWPTERISWSLVVSRLVPKQHCVHLDSLKTPGVVSHWALECFKNVGRKPVLLLLPRWSATICTIALHNLFYCTRSKPLSVFHTIADSVNVFILFISLSQSPGLWGPCGPCLLPGVWEPRSARHRDHFPSVAVVTSEDPANSSC